LPRGKIWPISPKQWWRVCANKRPDDRLLTGYRRLEDIARERTAIDEHGTKLFAQAFDPNTGKLTWKDAGDGERAGRMQLFKGSYLAYRNRRAHHGPKARLKRR